MHYISLASVTAVLAFRPSRYAAMSRSYPAWLPLNRWIGCREEK